LAAQNGTKRYQPAATPNKNTQVNEKTGQKDKYTTMLEEKFKVSCVEFDDQGQNTLHRSARDQNWKA